jgi:hypothetical protein
MWICNLAGHDHHWVTVDTYRVRVCTRCPDITTVIALRQWPIPVNVILGETTDTDLTGAW